MSVRYVVLACAIVLTFGEDVGDSWMLLQTRAVSVEDADDGATASGQQKLHCTDDVTGPFWGVWIDGRSAEEGPNVYSEQYNTAMQSTAAMVYDMARRQKSRLHYSVYRKITHSIGKFWAVEFTDHIQLLEDPHSNNIRKCWMSKLPTEFVSSAIDDIVLYDLDETFALRPSQNFNMTRKPSTIRVLFHMYNGKIADARTSNDKFEALAWLLRNMAYLHPLVDGNGRTRTMLLQHELRRLGLACGTMMYNNNLNIYFDNFQTYLKKIQEGIEMYTNAERTSANPWHQDFKLHDQAHRDRFRTIYTDTMQECTERECGTQDVDSYGANCQGSSIL